MAAIFVASSRPTVPEVISDTPDLFLHFIAYAGLAFLVTRAIVAGHWDLLSFASGVRAWLITAGYGVTDELHQWFVPGRFASVADWIADGVGAVAAIGAAAILRRRSRQRRANREV
jgi:VanZ family protein